LPVVAALRSGPGRDPDRQRSERQRLTGSSGPLSLTVRRPGAMFAQEVTSRERAIDLADARAEGERAAREARDELERLRVGRRRAHVLAPGEWAVAVHEDRRDVERVAVADRLTDDVARVDLVALADLGFGERPGTGDGAGEAVRVRR